MKQLIDNIFLVDKVHINVIEKILENFLNNLKKRPKLNSHFYKNLLNKLFKKVDMDTFLKKGFIQNL